MQQTDEEYFMERLTDSWINHSLTEFVNSVSCGGITDYDGFGEPYFVNRKTLKLEDSRDSLDLSLFVKGKDEPMCAVIERLHKEFDTDDHYLMGVFWYNK